MRARPGLGPDVDFTLVGFDDVESRRHTAFAQGKGPGPHRIGLSVSERVGPGEGRMDMARQHQVDPAFRKRLGRRLAAPDPGGHRAADHLGQRVMTDQHLELAFGRRAEPVTRPLGLAPRDLPLRPVGARLDAAGRVDAEHRQSGRHMGLILGLADEPLEPSKWREKPLEPGKHTIFATTYDDGVTRRSKTVDFFIARGTSEGQSLILSQTGIQKFYPYAAVVSGTVIIAVLILILYRIYSRRKQANI